MLLFPILLVACAPTDRLAKLDWLDAYDEMYGVLPANLQSQREDDGRHIGLREGAVLPRR